MVKRKKKKERKFWVFSTKKSLKFNI